MDAGGPGPVITSSDDRAKTWLIVAGGALATIAAVVALIALWPDGDGGAASGAGTSTSSGDGATTTTEWNGEPSQQPSTSTSDAVDLFRAGLPSVLGELRRAAGHPRQAIEITVYAEYAFLAYRDPAVPDHLDRRMWRDGEVGEAEPNPAQDRVDADTEPDLFDLAEVDPAVVATVAADAPSRYDVPVEVTHVIIDRFLPFDERVLLRVYTVPTDGRSGGGYVSYDTAGALVSVCC